MTSWLISSLPPLRRAKQRQLLPSRLPSVPSFAARLRLPSHILILLCCICDKLGGPAEVHSGLGHGAQIHRWPNVCRSQGLHKHHCWEKVASPSLHTLTMPTLASLAFPGSKILQCIVCVLITRQRLSGGSCMHAACNLHALVKPDQRLYHPLWSLLLTP